MAATSRCPANASTMASSYESVEESGGKLEMLGDSCVVVVSSIALAATRFKPRSDKAWPSAEMLKMPKAQLYWSSAMMLHDEVTRRVQSEAMKLHEGYICVLEAT
jgi:hypothetical protein